MALFRGLGSRIANAFKNKFYRGTNKPEFKRLYRTMFGKDYTLRLNGNVDDIVRARQDINIVKNGRPLLSTIVVPRDYNRLYVNRIARYEPRIGSVIVLNEPQKQPVYDKAVEIKNWLDEHEKVAFKDLEDRLKAVGHIKLSGIALQYGSKKIPTGKFYTQEMAKQDIYSSTIASWLKEESNEDNLLKDPENDSNSLRITNDRILHMAGRMAAVTYGRGARRQAKKALKNLSYGISKTIDNDVLNIINSNQTAADRIGQLEREYGGLTNFISNLGILKDNDEGKDQVFKENNKATDFRVIDSYADLVHFYDRVRSHAAKSYKPTLLERIEKLCKYAITDNLSPDAVKHLDSIRTDYLKEDFYMDKVEPLLNKSKKKALKGLEKLARKSFGEAYCILEFGEGNQKAYWQDKGDDLDRLAQDLAPYCRQELPENAVVQMQRFSGLYKLIGLVEQC